MIYEEEGGHHVNKNYVSGHLNFRGIDLLCYHSIRSASIRYYTLSHSITADIPSR